MGTPSKSRETGLLGTERAFWSLGRDRFLNAAKVLPCPVQNSDGIHGLTEGLVFHRTGCAASTGRGMIGAMTSLQIGLRPWVTPAGGLDADTWITRTVESRIEFSLDGRSVSELARAGDHIETVTIFDLDDKMLAAEVLLGQAVLSDGFPGPGRIPLMLCPCGDPGEGSLTVRLSLTDDTAIWDQWAWEYDYGLAPSEQHPELPACRFPIDPYRAAVNDAGRLATLVGGIPNSIVRVANHGDGIRRWIERRWRGELACQLDWLDVEMVHADSGEIESQLKRILELMIHIRNELAPVQAARRYVPTAEQSELVVKAASEILESPEGFRLPEETRQAVKWLRSQLSVAS